jgi:hypothetical protein
MLNRLGLASTLQNGSGPRLPRIFRQHGFSLLSYLAALNGRLRKARCGEMKGRTLTSVTEAGFRRDRLSEHMQAHA